MNIRKDSGPLKWTLIGISVLFLFVMLILPLSYVMYTAFSKGIKVFLAAVTDKYALHSIKLTIEVSLIAVVCNTFFGIFASWLITKFQFKGKKIISTTHCFADYSGSYICAYIRKTEFYISIS